MSYIDVKSGEKYKFLIVYNATVYTKSDKDIQINNRTIGYAELLRHRFVLFVTNLGFNNSSYPTRPHSIIVQYRNTLP
jgi:hypothetical protein